MVAAATAAVAAKENEPVAARMDVQAMASRAFGAQPRAAAVDGKGETRAGGNETGNEDGRVIESATESATESAFSFETRSDGAGPSETATATLNGDETGAETGNVSDAGERTDDTIRTTRE